MISGGRDNNKIKDQGRPDDEGEYVDYEEVD